MEHRSDITVCESFGSPSETLQDEWGGIPRTFITKSDQSQSNELS
jgi:hypothetical protein